MRYKILGRSGLRVSELCLGTMTFGDAWGWGAGQPECRQMFDAYASAGGNFIDTANRYTDGQSEALVGEFIAADRDHFVLATKYTLFDRKGDPNFAGNHRKNLVRSVEGSLRRLNTERIDLLWMHAWDGLTPVEEVMRALDDLVRGGKVLYVGVSDTPAWVVAQANTLAMLRGWTPFVALQIEYSLIQRTPERDLLPMARALDLAVTPWAILGRGILSGKYGQPEAPGSGRAAQWGILHERSMKIAAAVAEAAESIGCSPAQAAINWLRQQPGVIVPILGARTLDQLRDNLACLEHALPAELAGRLDEASRIELGFPHEFLASEGVREVISGGTFDQIDPHRPPGG
jgi:aryl-alcohol dehydrogenase-like predicted oxidoreductase